MRYDSSLFQSILLHIFYPLHCTVACAKWGVKKEGAALQWRTPIGQVKSSPPRLVFNCKTTFAIWPQLHSSKDGKRENERKNDSSSSTKNSLHTYNTTYLWYLLSDARPKLKKLVGIGDFWLFLTIFDNPKGLKTKTFMTTWYHSSFHTSSGPGRR